MTKTVFYNWSTKKTKPTVFSKPNRTHVFAQNQSEIEKLIPHITKSFNLINVVFGVAVLLRAARMQRKLKMKNLNQRRRRYSTWRWMNGKPVRPTVDHGPTSTSVSQARDAHPTRAGRRWRCWRRKRKRRRRRTVDSLMMPWVVLDSNARAVVWD